jgi:DNA topoisomerase-1
MIVAMPGPSTSRPTCRDIEPRGVDGPGVTRRRAGRGWSYRGPDGRVIRAADERARIAAIAIPPAWTDVWISPDPGSRIQATGRDGRGRKQYRYHPAWRRRRDRHKFDRMLAFAEALPAIRRRCEEDLSRRGLPRDKVVAAVVRLLELTLIRVGHDEYARINRSFGLATMLDRHVEVSGSRVRFRFPGKGGQRHDIEVRDRRLAAVVERSRSLPGGHLFQYLERGRPRRVCAADVNDYLRAASGIDVTAKDFRTWLATVIAFRELRRADPARNDQAGRRTVSQAMSETAVRLGNSAAVTRGSYVHPEVVEAYLEGEIGGSPSGGSDGAAIEPREERAARRLIRARRVPSP